MNRFFWKILFSFWFILFSTVFAAWLLFSYGFQFYYQERIDTQIEQINQELNPIKNYLLIGDNLAAIKQYYQLNSTQQSQITIYQYTDLGIISLTPNPDFFENQFQKNEEIVSWFNDHYSIEIHPQVKIIFSEVSFLILPYALLIFLFSAGLCYIFASILTKPIKKISQKVQLLSEGQFNELEKLKNKKSSRYSKDELGNLLKTFETMLESLLESYKNKDSLVRDMAHELRSPLARIQFANELIISSQSWKLLPKDLQAKSKRIEKDIIKLEELIQQSLNLFKQNSRYIQLDLVKTIEQVISESQFNYPKMAINFIHQPKKYKSFFLENTPLVFVNLIENAIKHSGSKKINIVLSKDDFYQVKVIDFGRGIEADKLLTIFEPYVRAYNKNDDSQDKSKIHGYGLGLSIAKKIIESQEGTIKAKNENGLTISLQLPIKK